MSIKLESVGSGQAAAIVHLYRQCFTPEHVERTIMNCHGASAYLASLMRFPTMQTDHSFIVARHQSRLVGFVHCRHIQTVWHLNHIAVLPEYRHRGIGTALFSAYVQSAKTQGLWKLSLQAEANQSALVEWYTRKGFSIQGDSYLSETTMPAIYMDIVQPEGISIARWSDAEAWQSIYGFSNFDLIWNDETILVNRLGDRYFSVNQVLSAPVLRALAIIDRQRRLLLRTTTKLENYQTVAHYYMMYGKAV